MSTHAAQTTARALVHQVATHGIAAIEPLTRAILDHIRDELDEFDRADERVIRTLRKGIESNLEEIASLLRSDIDVRARITPVGALDYALAMRREGMGLAVLERAYHLALVIFHVGAEANLRSACDDEETVRQALDLLDAFLWKYVAGLVERLADAYQTEEARGLPDPDSPLFTEGSTVDAARAYVEEIGTMGSDGVGERAAARARARAEHTLERFAQMLDVAADDDPLGAKLARADTRVAIVLADEEELALTLHLDREPIETEWGASEDAEATIRIASVDLKRLWSKEFQLPMAIARGRIEADGPVRKFLRILPILRELAENLRADGSRPDTREQPRAERREGESSVPG